MGDQVSLKSARNRKGAVVGGPRGFLDGLEYQVMFDQSPSWYSEHLLRRIIPESLPHWVSRDELLVALAAAKLKSGLTDALLSYNASRTQFVPYQYRPVLKFLGNPQQRILIADEVGLGKTIEAALIYLELKSRMEISRVLVLCPSRLTRKWQLEFQSRFDESFQILNAASFRTWLDDFDRFGEATTLKGIASFESLRRDEFILAF